MYFADICEPGWTYFKGFCYLTSKTCQNWTTARYNCRQENSVLVDVQNNEENVFLQHLHNGEKSWLGFNDIFTEGSFTWVDNGTGNFTAWARNQPNNFRDEDCVHTLGVEYCTCNNGYFGDGFDCARASMGTGLYLNFLLSYNLKGEKLKQLKLIYGRFQPHNPWIQVQIANAPSLGQVFLFCFVFVLFCFCFCFCFCFFDRA